MEIINALLTGIFKIIKFIFIWIILLPFSILVALAKGKK